MTAIGFAGTAKNTGKTTSLNAFHHFLRQQGYRCLLTSIGLDGEAYDQLTYLPKPRIEVYPGDWVITASECYSHSHVPYRRHQTFPIHTPLGEPALLEITGHGDILVAGPSTAGKLQTILDSLSDSTIDYVLVDGALNRLFPLSLCHKLVLTTGAARNLNPALLADEIRSLTHWINSFSLISPPDSLIPPGLYRRNQLVHPLDSSHTPNLEERTIHRLLEIMQECPDHYSLSWNRLIFWDSLQSILSPAWGSTTLSILLDHPFCIMGEIRAFPVERLVKASSAITLLARKITRVMLVTLNPFYPQPVYASYRKGSIDTHDLQTAFHQDLSIPAIDLLRIGPEDQARFFSLLL
ncbi:MAG: hypothetical protein KBA26_11980 [Candidatus Delongbacteria bacterium]|nr:hypothetical protein [Candidatus Delongbacteria bacterium]